MGAPKGNQYALGNKGSSQFGNKNALGNKGGAPRKTSFSKEEMIALGEEMIEWIKVNNPLHLSEWYTIEKMFIYNQWKTFIQREEFIPYYEIALKLVGRNYLNCNSNVHPSIAQRWQRVYFKDLRESEDEEVAYKAETVEQIKAKYATKDEPLDREKESLQTALDTVNFLQSVARKIEDSNINKETKS